MARQVNVVLILLSCLALVFAFAGRLDPYTARSLHAAWNVGHVAAFFLWTLLFLRWIPAFAGRSLPRRLLFCAVLALTAGSLIELIQIVFNREISIMDIANDVLGSLLAASMVNGITIHTGKSRRILLIIGLCLMTVIVNSRVLVSLFDEYMAHGQFPVLADFSSVLQQDRFGGNAKQGLAHRHGRAALEITLGTERYSGFALKHFPRDWGSYSTLLLMFENPGDKTLDITCRIHDRQHSDGDEEYNDRFNRSYQLTPGDNTVNILLEDVIKAPATRKLDIRQVGSLGCFTVKLPEPRTLYLHEIRLLR